MDEPCCQPVDTVVGLFVEEDTPSPAQTLDIEDLQRVP